MGVRKPAPHQRPRITTTPAAPTKAWQELNPMDVRAGDIIKPHGMVTDVSTLPDGSAVAIRFLNGEMETYDFKELIETLTEQR